MCAVRVKKGKHVTSMGQNREPTIRSCDTGQRIPCFSSSTWMCNIIPHYLTTNISRMDRTKIFLAMGLRYNLLLPRRTDSWLPPPSPRVGRVSVRSYADVITKFCRMDRLPNFLSCSYTFARRASAASRRSSIVSLKFFLPVGFSKVSTSSQAQIRGKYR